MTKRTGPKPKTVESCIEIMCEGLSGTIAERTIRGYREDMKFLTKRLQESGHHYWPWDIDEEDVRWLLQDFQERGHAISTRRGYISAVRTYTKFYGNNAVRNMKIRWPHDDRPTVDWLSEEQAKHLLRLDMNPVQEFVVHCELCLGMRRIEVLRLTTDSFQGEFVNILGKGSQGGKPRIMHCHRDTGRVLNRFLRYRNDLIAYVKSATSKEVIVPDRLLIYAKGTKLRTYTEKGSGIDALLKPLGEQIGYDFSNHTLRRTFGRIMYRSGVRLPTIAAMLGHESVEMTMKYIGVNFDDMSGAMDVFRL